VSAGDVRARTRAQWAAAAPHWGRLADTFADMMEPVTEWLLDAAALRPGARVLELAAGPDEVGLRAAERVRPGGEVVISDAVPEMLDVAQARAPGAPDVTFKLLDVEWIDEPTASYDAVLCRFGLMFPLDLLAGARECRRVLRPGGRLATAAWDGPEHNPWASEVRAELLDQGLAEPPAPDAPGPFRLSPPGRLRELLQDAGFVDVRVEPLELTVRHAGGFDDFWAVHSEQSSAVREALAITNERGAAALREGVRRRLERFAQPDGSLLIPARPLVAVAEA
jgi:SAM-dependent methyltransferase